MVDLSEKETRERIIDPWLIGDAGWREEYIRREVNSIKSDFKIKRYEIKKGEGKEEGRFIDYVLLDEHKNPLAIIEAKRFSLDAEKGSIQATTYQKDIESQINFAVPIFLTNGEPTKKVWFYKMEADGYSLDDKRTPIDEINYGDIKDILEHFKKRDKENPINRKKKYFFVPIEEIKEKNWDLSISKYREIEYAEIKYEKPEEIKKKIIKLEEDILKGLRELKI